MNGTAVFGERVVIVEVHRGHVRLKKGRISSTDSSHLFADNRVDTVVSGDRPFHPVTDSPDEAREIIPSQRHSPAQATRGAFAPGFQCRPSLVRPHLSGSVGHQDPPCPEAAASRLGPSRRAEASRPVITLLAYEPHNHRSSRKGPRRLAGGYRQPHGSRPGSDCARALAKGQSRSWQPPVHEARRRGARPPDAVPPQGFLRVVKGIADTGFLVAFVNRADEHHDWAVSIAEQVTVITVDRQDFRVYRRNKRETIPLICPP